MKFILITASLTLLSVSVTRAQVNEQQAIDSLKQEIMRIETKVDNINLNLERSRSKFQKGILVATIGYTVTIAGGLMLGRENDDVGQVLLIAGGVTGITGTYMMVDAFKFLGRTKKE